MAGWKCPIHHVDSQGSVCKLQISFILSSLTEPLKMFPQRNHVTKTSQTNRTK